MPLPGDVPVPVRPAATPEATAQQVVLMPSFHVSLSVAKRADFTQIEPLFGSIARVRETYVYKKGEEILSSAEVDSRALGATTTHVIRDPRVTSVVLIVSVVGRHHSPHALETPLMLTSVQSFHVKDGKITPHEDRSPLFEVSARGNDVEVMVQVDVLDFTAYWFDLKTDDSGKQFLKDRARELARDDDAESVFRCLLHLGKTPSLWTASVPKKALTSSRAAISAFFFFIPYYETFGTLDVSKGPRWSSLFHVTRYLLAPAPDSVEGPTGQRDDFFLYGKSHFVWIRIGIERALRKSGKDAVMFGSLSNRGSHGDAGTAALPEMITRALQLMASMDLVSRSRSRREVVSLGKLAIGGYSESGDIVRKALEANVSRRTEVADDKPVTRWASPVHEVYVFDTRHTTFAVDTWRGWMTLPDVRLRVTRFAGSPADVVVAAAKSAGLDKDGRLTVWVTDVVRWNEEHQANDWWRYVMRDTTHGGGKNGLTHPRLYDYGHQFAVLGGRGDRSRGESFFFEFLNQSAL